MCSRYVLLDYPGSWLAATNEMPPGVSLAANLALGQTNQLIPGLTVDRTGVLTFMFESPSSARDVGAKCCVAQSLEASPMLYTTQGSTKKLQEPRPGSSGCGTVEQLITQAGWIYKSACHVKVEARIYYMPCSLMVLAEGLQSEPGWKPHKRHGQHAYITWLRSALSAWVPT